MARIPMYREPLHDFECSRNRLRNQEKWMGIQRKGWVAMIPHIDTTYCVAGVCLLLVAAISFAQEAENGQMEKGQYEEELARIRPLIQSMALRRAKDPKEQELARIRALAQSVTSGRPEDVKEEELARIRALAQSVILGRAKDLKEYEEFADEIQQKWSKKNREYHARLMLELCRPLSSGCFGGQRQYEIARGYALSALGEPDAIPIEVELELIGHVMTDTFSRTRPRGEDFARRRRIDVKARLHAWKRLKDAIDPDWDPNEELQVNPMPPAATLLASGVAPEAIEDPALRAEYEAAIETNRKKIEKHAQQHRLRKWLKRFPKNAERYIIRMYSKRPLNTAELEQYLAEYGGDVTAKKRILQEISAGTDKAKP